MADLPIKELGDEAPLYDRPFVERREAPVIDAAATVAPPLSDRRGAAEADRLAGPVLEALGLGAVRPRHLGNTVQRPGGDAAVVRVARPERRWR